MSEAHNDYNSPALEEILAGIAERKKANSAESGERYAQREAQNELMALAKNLTEEIAELCEDRDKWKQGEADANAMTERMERECDALKSQRVSLCGDLKHREFPMGNYTRRNTKRHKAHAEKVKALEQENENLREVIANMLGLMRPPPDRDPSPYWVAHCSECGWFGISSECAVEAWGEEEDVLCPVCGGTVDEMDGHDSKRIAATYNRIKTIAEELGR